MDEFDRLAIERALDILAEAEACKTGNAAMLELAKTVLQYAADYGEHASVHDYITAKGRVDGVSSGQPRNTEGAPQSRCVKQVTVMKP